MTVGDQTVLDRSGLDALLAALGEQGYRVVGPVVRNGAIGYDQIAASKDLPEGWSDEQAPGRYRLKRRPDGALFGHHPGPQSWKRFLHPPRVTLLRARRDGGGVSIEPAEAPAPRHAFVGVRPCELWAIAIQDQVLLRGGSADPVYQSRRKAAFVVAVHCTQPGASCFCASLGTGPRAEAGYDLAMTELVRDGRHEFLVEIGTGAGAEALAGVPRRPATSQDRSDASAALEAAGRGMRRLPAIARDAAREAGLGPVCWNPFRSIVVRSVETLFACDEALRILEAYEPPDRPAVEVAPRAAEGHACTEAPRGILYHRYRIGADGLIAEARIVPPTAQNQKAIEGDLWELVPRSLDLPREALTLRCEQAVRNHGPCISCATHFLRLNVEE